MDGSFENLLDEKLDVLTAKLRNVPLPQLFEACKNMCAKIGPGKKSNMSDVALEAPMDEFQDLISLLASYNAEHMLESYYSEDGPPATDALSGNTFENVVDFKGLYTVFRFDYLKKVEEESVDMNQDYNAKKMLASRALLNTLSDFDAVLQTALGLSSPDFDLTEVPVPRERGGRNKKAADTGEGSDARAGAGQGDTVSASRPLTRRKPGPKPGFKRRGKATKEALPPPPPVDNTWELTLVADSGDEAKPVRGTGGGTKGSGAGRRLSASSRAKWMSREGTKMARGNVQPNDLLRCLLSELRSSGLVVKSIESKLAIIQNTPELTVGAPLLPIAQVYHMASTSSAAKTSAPAVTKDEQGQAESSPGRGNSDRNDIVVERPVAASSVGSSSVEREAGVDGTKTCRGEARPDGSTEQSVTPSRGRSEAVCVSPAVASIVGRHRAKGQKNFTRIAENMDELLRKPHGRLASSVIAECLAHLHDAHEAFDNTWRDLCAQNSERFRKAWVGSAAARLALGGVNLDAITPPVTLQDVPMSADLIVNPFSSSSKDDQSWNFLTSLEGYGTKQELYRRLFGAEDPPTSPSHAMSRMTGQLDHPFIHQDSLYFRTAPVEDCLPSSQLHALSEELTSFARPANGSLSNGVPESPRQLRKRSLSEVESPSAAAQQSPLKAARTVKMEGLPRQRPPIPCGPSLQFCVDRTLAMLQMGHNAFVVDKTTYVDNDGNPQPHSWHRAKIVSLITRSCLGEASVDGVSVVSKFKGRGKKIGQTSRWGPILVVVKAKELFKWEEVFRDEFKLPVAAENGVGSHARLMTYCGSDADRTLLRSYLTSSSLYTQRSHCHIVLTHYEALATDLVHLKTVHWQLMVLDSAWSIMSHSTYKHFMHELLGMTCRHRILSCPQLGFYKATADKTAEGPKLVSLLRTYFPDPLAALRFVFPSMWDFMEHFLGNEDASDGLTHRLIAHVLSALTAVCDESLSSIIRDGCNEEDIKLYYDITENLPWLEWEGAGYVVRPTQSNESAPENGVSRFYLLFDIDYTIQTTMSYADEDMARELKGVKMESIGKAANSQRRRSRNRSKPAGTVLSVPSGEDGDMKERKRPGRKPGWAAAAAAAASAAKMKEELDRLEVLEGEEDGNDEGVQERVEDGEVGGEDKSDDEEDEEGEDGDGENNDMEVVADEEDDPVEPAPDSSQSGFLDSVLRIVVGGGGGHQKDGDEEGDDEDKGGGEALASQAMVSDVDLEELGGQDGDDSVSAPSKLEGGRGGRGTVGASQYPKPISIKKYDEEDEKKRSICQRGGQWQVSVAFPGRLRFFGSFPSEESAMRAYRAALAQRNLLQEQGLTCLPRMKFVGDKHGAYSVGGTGAGKKRTSKETTTDEQLIARMTDDNLVDSVRDMLQPFVSAHLDLGDWASPDSRPPAFAKLCGPEGFTSYITQPSCILGRMIATTVALANSLGLDDPVGLPGCPGEVDIHLGDDPSVARSHARIAYNSSKRCFEIRCLHPSGIFVGGVKFLPESEAIPLTNWTVIQIGYRIFYFLLPEKSRQTGKNIPAEFARTLMAGITASLRVRRLGFGIDGGYLPYSNLADDDPAAGEAATDTLLDDMASLQKVVLNMVKPPTPPTKRTAREKEEVPSKATSKEAAPAMLASSPDVEGDDQGLVHAAPEPHRDINAGVGGYSASQSRRDGSSARGVATTPSAAGLEEHLRASAQASDGGLDNKPTYQSTLASDAVIRSVIAAQSLYHPPRHPVVGVDPFAHHQSPPGMRQWVAQQGSGYAELPASMGAAADAARTMHTPSISMAGSPGNHGIGDHQWVSESLGTHDAMFPFHTSPVGFQVQQIPRVPQWNQQQNAQGGSVFSAPKYHLPNSTSSDEEVGAAGEKLPNND